MGKGPRLWVLPFPLASVLWSTAVFAGSCGGPIPCRCGDVVTSDYALTADLGPCLGHGLVIGSNVTLDCRGQGVSGLGDGSEQYGIYLNGSSGATVRGCEVTRFLRGIRLRAAAGNVVIDNYSHENGDFAAHAGYGIDMAVGSKDNLLQENTVQRNADEGIHLGSDTGPNQLVGNALSDNYREQLYVLASDGNSFVGNTMYGSGSNSLYLKDSSDNYLEGNTFGDRTARVTGAASGNVFVGNSFVNATLQFRVYDGETPHRIPSGNRVLGGTMRHTGTCLRFTDTSDNVVSDVALVSCGMGVVSEGTAREPSANALVNVALDPAEVSADTSSTLSVGWQLRGSVRDPSGAPIPGARVQAVDVTGAVAFDLLTDGAGSFGDQVLVQYVRIGSGTGAKTPHAITASKVGYLPDAWIVEAAADLDVTLVLSPAGGPAGGSAVTFSDSFDRPDSPAPGNGWLEAAGHLVVGGGELRVGGTKGYNLAVLPVLVGSDQSAACDFVSVNNSTSPRFGVVLRYRDTRNYYALYWKVGGTGALRISRVVDGVEKVLGFVPVKNPAMNSSFRLGGQASGTTLTLDVDGIARLSVSDASLASGSPGVLLGSKSTKTYRADNFTAAVE